MTWPLAIGTVLGLALCRWIGSLLFPEQFRKELAPWASSSLVVLASAAVGLSLTAGLLAAFLCFTFVLASSMYRARATTTSEQSHETSDGLISFAAGFFANAQTACHGQLQVSATRVSFSPTTNRSSACRIEPLMVGSKSRATGRAGRWNEHKTLFGPRDVLEVWDDETLVLSMVCRDAKSKADQINQLWTA